MTETIRLEPPLYCAFCGRDRELVSKMVQCRFGVCICDECVDAAYWLIHGGEKEDVD
jgi:ATP-dependent protease Clp ATPase subunit